MNDRLAGRGMTLVRGDRCLFRELDFSLCDGELLMVQGPNGSGKTSLLRAIAGLLELEEGQVLWEGIPAEADRQAFCARFAWMGHRPGFKGDLTVRENLAFEAGLRPMTNEPIGVVLPRLGLGRLDDLPFRVLSAGQQRRLALARLLLSPAPLWIVDEPYTNLDNAGQGLFAELLAAHLAAGGLSVLASHQHVAFDAPIRHIAL